VTLLLDQATTLHMLYACVISADIVWEWLVCLCSNPPQAHTAMIWSWTS